MSTRRVRPPNVSGQSLGCGQSRTDPLLIAWFLIAEAAFNFALCMMANAAAGFITRPPRIRRRIAATSAVA
ncbi:hypothetical protein [Streptomyces sp. NRRL F-5126]|uniref:hypothetical protein n=1 Tax=Streptomyces sp. NRRL F-5126 TaxID=1463857 RepID=UPI0004CAAC3E|nr:hypothetical protein [Streptomyces sp. NRRL F-5126]